MQTSLPTQHPEQTVNIDDLAARVALRLLNPQLDPAGSVIKALAATNRELAATGNAGAIRGALARQAGLLELAAIGFLNKAAGAPDASSAEAFGRLATRAANAHLQTLSALHSMNRDEHAA